MERDKRGRFVKKFQNSGTISNNYSITIDGILYTLKPEYVQDFKDFYDKNLGNKYIIKNWLEGQGKDWLETDLNSNNTIRYEDPSIIQSNAQEEKDPRLELDIIDDTYSSNEENSAGVNEIYGNRPIKDFIGNILSKPINKEKLANFLELSKYGIAASINKKMAERSLEAEKPFLQDVSESHRNIYGDYRAQVEGEQSAAQLRNMASKPLISDGALQQQMMMDAQIKGQEFINQGNAQDEAMIKQTRESAWQQEKENQQQRQAVAMQNKRAMLMSEKNKAQIENARDSAMQSMVIDPLLSSREQRLRNEAVEQQTNQDYYYEKMLPREVLNTIELTDPKQKALRTLWVNQGYEGVQEAIAEGTYTQNDFDQLSQLINDEILKRQMDYKGVSLNTPSSDPYDFWKGSQYPIHKTGGIIYKAKLVKRTRDNDRTAKSIESSKKIAARFLEKALDSLYTYKEVELIAKPKKKRKYQSGGSIPFVGATPVFATSERGATQLKKKEESEDEGLSTKDIIELIMQAQILPSDSDAILAELRNFTVSSYNDPFGLSTSSDITSRYMSIISKIKKAQANREWYDKTFDKLSKDGILNEYAITSKGKLIGMNQEGDFQFFDPTVMTRSEFESTGYQLLTNNNLLDIRAKYPMAAFNHNMILEAANGIGMTQITDYISKVIQNLGSEKTQSQIFGDSSKEVLAGLRQLQSAAQEAGQDLSISQMYEANMMNENQVNQAQSAIIYLWDSLPSNMKSLILAKTESYDEALNFVTSLVNSKLSSTRKLEFSPKKVNSDSNSKSKSKTGTGIDGLDLSPAQMLQRGYGERETIVIQNSTSTGLKVDAIKMPITKNGNDTIGSGTLEDVSRSQYGGILDFTNASMGKHIIPFEGRRNIAVDGTKIYSMYLPIDQDEFYSTGNIIPDLDLVDKLNKVNQIIKEKQITDISEINAIYEQSGLPTYLTDSGNVIPTSYRRFGVLNGTAINRAFGINDKILKDNKFLKEVDNENLINGAIDIMNHERNSKDKIDFDGGWFGDDVMYQGTIFIPISNDVFAGIAGNGQTITSEVAEDLYEKQQQQQRVNATYINPGELQ